jgi:hypothetical protein
MWSWRIDSNENVEEVFQYDALNCLTQVWSAISLSSPTVRDP